MSKKVVYSKHEHGIGDFVYVDLLPDVKRARQFNVNVIIGLLLAVSLTYVLIFLPYRAATETFETLNGDNNDLRHEMVLTQEEFVGYEIDLTVLQFEDDIEELQDLKVDFNNLLDDVELQVGSDGDITFISYNAEINQLRVTVSMTNFYSFNTLDQKFLNLGWVVNSQYTEPSKIGDDVQYSATYILEVNPNAE